MSFTRDSTLTVPRDFREESFYMANGHQYWKAAELTVPVLLMRGALDCWSRPEDITACCNELTNAPRKKCVVIENGTHMVFLDKPEKGRDQLIREIMTFIL